MDLSAGTNFDDALPGSLKETKVTTLYGKLSADLVGGGRPTFALPHVDWNRLEQHLHAVHGGGLRFNYLLNAACLDNRETTIEFEKEFREMLGRLKELGVDSLTLTSPFLIRRVKRILEKTPVILSTFSDVHSLQQVHEYTEMGVDEITLPESKNRDFPFLKALRLQQQKGNTGNCKFRLIATNDCLLNCPYRAQHANFQSHASQSCHNLNGFALDYYMLCCTCRKLENPWRLLQAPWIRPEDLQIYEEMGFDRFKLTERMKRTAQIVKTAQAYSERCYHGNLLKLLNTRLSQEDFEMPDFRFNTRKDLAPEESMARIYSLLFALNVEIENDHLDGFLEEIRSRNGTCDTSDCNTCGICKRWAQKTLSVPAYVEKDSQAERFHEVLKSLETGTFFQDKAKAFLSQEGAELLDFLVGKKPVEFQKQARCEILAKAGELAAKNEDTIRRKEIARATLLCTPEPYRQFALADLRQLGIDPDQFGGE